MEQTHYYESRFDDGLHMVSSTKLPGMQHGMLQDADNHCVGNAPLKEIELDPMRERVAYPANANGASSGKAKPEPIREIGRSAI